jgi:hypothetical protein
MIRKKSQRRAVLFYVLYYCQKKKRKRKILPNVTAEQGHMIHFEIGDGLLLSSEELPPPSHEVLPCPVLYG